MSFFINAKSVFPTHEYSQNQIEDFFMTIWPENKDHVRQFSKSVGVDKRAFCLRLENILELNSFAQRNSIWKEQAVPLAEESIHKVFEGIELKLSDVDLFITTSVTGFAIPSLDALLMNKMEFKQNVKRMPLFGFGCLGGLASLNRAHEYLENNTNGVVLINAVELCSLTFQQHDRSIPNLVGTSLFADGAAAVIMVGRDHHLAKNAKLEMVDYEAFFYKNTENTMGWNIIDSGFQLILNNNVSEVVGKNIPENLKLLLYKNDLSESDIKFSVSHPGGPKVLLSLQESLGLGKETFQDSWDSLNEHGNLSSVSILNVLEKNLNKDMAETNAYGIMAAMGPGFNSEISIIKRVK